MNAVLVIILGLMVGSFLNAVIYRLHAKVSFLRGRSYCPHCKHTLATKDLLPVISFVMLRGRCRYCRKAISWQYPLVELATALAFLLLYGTFGLGVELFVYFVYTAFLIIMFVYDLRYYLILDKVSLPLMLVAALGSWLLLRVDPLQLLYGAVAVGGFFLLQFMLSRGKWIGGGDIRLGVVMGLMLGWPQVLVALFIAYCFGSVVGIGLVLTRQKRWQSQVPFGTFLTAATFAGFFLSDRVVQYYIDLFAL